MVAGEFKTQGCRQITADVAAPATYKLSLEENTEGKSKLAHVKYNPGPTNSEHKENSNEGKSQTPGRETNGNR